MKKIKNILKAIFGLFGITIFAGCTSSKNQMAPIDVEEIQEGPEVQVVMYGMPENLIKDVKESNLQEQQEVSLESDGKTIVLKKIDGEYKIQDSNPE